MFQWSIEPAPIVSDNSATQGHPSSTIDGAATVTCGVRLGTEYVHEEMISGSGSSSLAAPKPTQAVGLPPISVGMSTVNDLSSCACVVTSVIPSCNVWPS